MPIYINQTGEGKLAVRVHGNTTETVELADGGPGCIGYHITRLLWSTLDSAGHSATIKRGNNTIAVLHASGEWDLSGRGLALNEWEDQPVVITLTDNSTAIVVLSKIFAPGT